MKKLVIAAALAVLTLGLSACNEADVASRNVSTAADNFQIARRITFYNGITDQQALIVEGFCSLGNNDPAYYTTITCKTEKGEYLKSFLFRSDNMAVMVEQLEPAAVSGKRYKVIWRPTSIIPDIEIK